MCKFLTPLILLIFFFGFLSCKNQQEESDTKKNTTFDTVTTTEIDPFIDSLSEPLIDTMKTAYDNIHSLREIYLRTQKKPTTFVIKANRDTTIKCNEGTLLSIPANCFLRAKDGEPVNGNIKISVKEFYKISDMLMANITTSSNGNIIETGGMLNIKVNAKDNNDSLILQNGKNITIALPTFQNNSNGMLLFNGLHDSVNNINWIPRNGITGEAQKWKTGNYFPYEFSDFSKNKFVFGDDSPKKVPIVQSKFTNTITSEITITLRDAMQIRNSIGKQALGYIDTIGNLHIYKIGSYNQNLLFNTDFNSTFYKIIKVNVPVCFNVTIKTNINKPYYEKLFKMKKANPDSMITATISFLPQVKKYSFENFRTKFDNAITVTEYKKDLNKFYKQKAEYDKRIKQLVNNPVANINSAQEYLLLSTQKLGWINCDRFYSNPNKVNYLVKSDEKIKLLIVFNNIKSILSNHKNGLFCNLPDGEKITIVALKVLNNKLMLAMHETTITSEPFEKLDFKQVTANEYKAKLQKLNSL